MSFAQKSEQDLRCRAPAQLLNHDLVRLCLAAMSDPSVIGDAPKEIQHLVVLALCSNTLAMKLFGVPLLKLFAHPQSKPAILLQARELQDACFAVLRSSRPAEWTI